MAFTAERFDLSRTSQWNEFVENSNNGSIFQRLDFLSYHGERFTANEHHLAINKGNTLCGVMPTAIFDENGKRVARSPYGGSYGGCVFRTPLGYRDSCHIIEAILEYFATLQVVDLRLVLPISICHREYSATFCLALIEHGFQCVNRDITSVVNLEHDTPIADKMTSRARNMMRKAQKLGVDIQHNGSIDDFWSVMDKTFAKHEAKPTHTKDEFLHLHKLFPEKIYVDVAYWDHKPIAGIGLVVVNDRVNSSFYLCQDPDNQHVQALSLLIYQALVRAQEKGFRWFDFGTSSVNMKGRANVFQFKESFNAIGIFRETYLWSNT